MSLLLGSVALNVHAQQMEVGSFRSEFPGANRQRVAADYNLKWGRLRGHLAGSLQVEYNDNIFLLKDNAVSDCYFYPNVALGLLWPISRDQTVYLDVDFGYLGYVDQDQLSSFYIAPGSRLEYQIGVPDANLQILLHEAIGTTMDPTSRPEISSLGTNSANASIFRRLENTAGLTAVWRPTRPLKVTGGYAFSLVRSLSGDFTEQDLDTHSFNVGANYAVASAWTAGVLGRFVINNYVENVLNSGSSYTIGPTVSFSPMQSLNVHGSVGYTAYQFDSNGTINDSSAFTGVTFDTGVRQTLTRALSHDLRFSRRADAGWVSNFTEVWEVLYELNALVTRNIKANAMLTYQNYAESGPNADRGDRYLARLGAGYHFARHWNMDLGYSFALKDAEQNALDYTQNRLTLQLTHAF